MTGKKKKKRAGKGAETKKQSEKAMPRETGKRHKNAEKKPLKTDAKADASKKLEKPEKKKIKRVEFKNPEKSAEAKKMRWLARERPRRLFRGRFGQRNMIRNIRDEKWQKWRKPRGIDIRLKREDGLRVKVGFRTPKEIRYVHPSGFKEVLVCNAKQLEEAAKEKANAARISRTVGLRKRNELLKKAVELKIWVLNP